MGDIQIKVSIPLDDSGMLGRECLKCEKFFKLKPGTGLPTSHCHCPYCEYEGDANTFWTKDQIDYAKSIALKEGYERIVKPALKTLDDSFKRLERTTRNSMFQVRVTRSGPNEHFSIKYYKEEDLETNITCDSCGLMFSIYGLFARCPDCCDLNAFTVYGKSLEVLQKQLAVLPKLELDTLTKERFLISILSGCISTFDGLGKELRRKQPELYPAKPNNLFQNLTALNDHLGGMLSRSHPDYDSLFLMFQVRHIMEHNMGVVDEEFVKKLPQFSSFLGRKYQLRPSDVEKLIKDMTSLGDIVEAQFVGKMNGTR